MQVTIHITEQSTTEQLKAVRALIDSLLGEDWPTTERPSTEAAPVEEAKPKRTRRTKAEIEAEKEEAAEEVDNSPAAANERVQEKLKERRKTEPDPKADDAEKLQPAIDRATELVAAGKVALVKAALNEADVKRVSELKESDVPAFLAALEGE